MINFFSTSIFDSSIYRAWTKVLELMMPKSSKLNQLSNQLREDLGLYAAFVIERRTGLPICASKTLLDDAALVGSTSRVMITIEKVLPEFQLSGVTKFIIHTGAGILEVRLFAQFFILVLLYPASVDLNSPQATKALEQFIDLMQTNI